MGATLTYSSRVRLLVRVPDKENKYRDEFVQERELLASYTDSDTSGVIEMVNIKVAELRAEMFREAARLGGCDYQEKVVTKETA
jgi:hypothetical protein